jgi:NAD(P)H-quinone oxidoreductase subunit L
MLDNLPISLSPDLLSPDVLLAAALYVALAGAYLVVVPLALMFYLKERWYTAGSVERTILYALVFAFFPGMLLFSPFLNFRPQMRSLNR